MKNIYSSITLLFIGLFCTSVLYANAKKESYLIPLMIDRETVVSDIAIRYDMQPVGSLGRDFLNTKNGLTPSDLSFQDFIFSIKSNIWQSGQSSEPERALGGLHKAFGAYVDDMLFIGKAFVGDSIVYLCRFSMESPKRNFTRGFVFARSEEGSWRYVGYGGNKLYSLIVAAFNISPDGLGYSVSPKLSEYTHQNILYGKETVHPVEVLFKGKYVDDIKVFEHLNEVEKVENPVVGFYIQAYQLFASSIFQFVDCYTRASRDRYLKWLNNLNIDAVNDYVDRIIQEDRRLFFVLNSDPIYILFFEYQNGAEKGFDYEIVYLKNDKYFLTSFRFYHYFDALLRSSNMFDWDAVVERQSENLVQDFSLNSTAQNVAQNDTHGKDIQALNHDSKKSQGSFWLVFIFALIASLLFVTVRRFIKSKAKM